MGAVLRFVVPILVAIGLWALWVWIAPKVRAACKKHDLEALDDLNDVAKAAKEKGGAKPEKNAKQAAKAVREASAAAENAQEALK